MAALSQESDFQVRLSATQVPQHSVFEVSFTLDGGQGTNFQPPAFRDFEVVAGPSIGQSTTIINGDISWQMVWSYTLLAKRQGRFTIGPASVNTGRKTISTQPVTVVVGPPASAAQPGLDLPDDAPLLLVAETDGNQFYPGQQIILSYKLYFRENVHSASTLAEDDYAEFFVEPMTGHRWATAQARISGIDYAVQPVKVIALYAHQSGTYTIDPLVLSVGLQRAGPGMPGIFSMLRAREVNLNSEPVNLRIIPLPEGAPPTFTGAVGDYYMRLGEHDRRITTAQALTVRVEIIGEGDPKRWDPPVPVIRGPAEAYAPRILADKPVVSDSGLTYRREIEYQILPTDAGELVITFPFTYFDPRSGEYVTQGTDSIRVEVLDGVGSAGAPVVGGSEATQTFLPKAVSFRTLPDKFWTSPLFLLLFAGLAVIGMWVNWRARRVVHGVPEARGESAASAALRALEHLQGQPGSLNVAEDAAAIFFTFLSDRFAMPAADLSAQNLEAVLRSSELTDVVKADTLRFFHRCELVRYGGMAGMQEAASFVEDCREIIHRLEQ